MSEVSPAHQHRGLVQPAPSSVIGAFVGLMVLATVLASVLGHRSVIELVAAVSVMMFLGAVCGGLFAYVCFSRRPGFLAAVLRGVCAAGSLVLLCVSLTALALNDDWPYTVMESTLIVTGLAATA